MLQGGRQMEAPSRYKSGAGGRSCHDDRYETRSRRYDFASPKPIASNLEEQFCFIDASCDALTQPAEGTCCAEKLQLNRGI